MRTLTIGKTLITIWDESRYLEVTLPDGRKLPAAPQEDGAYLRRAQEYGYGDDVWAMCVDHEVGHVLLSWLVHGDTSLTLKGVAEQKDGGSYWPNWWAEEDAVLGMQRLAKFTGTSIIEMAAKFASA